MTALAGEVDLYYRDAGFMFRLEHKQPSKVISQFSSVSTRKCSNTVSTMTGQLSTERFPVRHSPIILSSVPPKGVKWLEILTASQNNNFMKHDIRKNRNF